LLLGFLFLFLFLQSFFNSVFGFLSGLLSNFIRIFLSWSSGGSSSWASSSWGGGSFWASSSGWDLDDLSLWLIIIILRTSNSFENLLEFATSMFFMLDFNWDSTIIIWAFSTGVGSDVKKLFKVNSRGLSCE